MAGVCDCASWAAGLNARIQWQMTQWSGCSSGGGGPWILCAAGSCSTTEAMQTVSWQSSACGAAVAAASDASATSNRLASGFVRARYHASMTRSA